MTLTLRSILERGTAAKERITMRAKSDLDVGDFALLQCKYADGILTTDVERAFWFPYGPVLSGDLIVVYSKSGDTRNKTLANGSKVHFFYWGCNGAIWQYDDYGAVILNAPKWSSKTARELSA